MEDLQKLTILILILLICLLQGANSLTLATTKYKGYPILSKIWRLPASLIPMTKSVSTTSGWSFCRHAGPEGDRDSSVTVKTRISQKTDQVVKHSYIEDIESDWRLILHDDAIHTIEEVCDIITECIPVCPGPRAYEVTLEVHMSGAATVAVANKKIIDEYCKSLQKAGLSVSMAPDAAFERDNEL